jgi:hypothetical protein
LGACEWDGWKNGANSVVFSRNAIGLQRRWVASKKGCFLWYRVERRIEQEGTEWGNDEARMTNGWVGGGGPGGEELFLRSR